MFNKIHLYTKNGGTEQELDADKATESTDPVERMLGILKGAQLPAIVKAAGQIKSIQGDEEIKNKLLAGLSPGDTCAKSVASQQWDRQVKDGLLKNGTAVIRSEGEITGDKSPGYLNGTPYTADIRGKSESDLAMETTTGMLLGNTSESTITGTISSMGRDIPVATATTTF